MKIKSKRVVYSFILENTENIFIYFKKYDIVLTSNIVTISKDKRRKNERKYCKYRLIS